MFGTAASGATRLAGALGRRPGFFLLGDVKKLWARGLRDDRACGCGRAFSSCSFWAEIGGRAFGGWSNVDAGRVVAAARHVHSLRGVLDRGSAAIYAAHVRRLLAAVDEVVGPSTIVLHSKSPYQGPVLARVSTGSVRWVHVVRDPRAVVWMWMNGTVVLRPRLPLAASTARIVGRWARYNAPAPVAARVQRVPYARVRFEDLVQRPSQVLDDAVRFAGGARRPGVDPGDHAVMMPDRDSGPCRLSEVDDRLREEAATMSIPEEDRWEDDLHPAIRVAVTAGTLPLLGVFGYPVARRPSPRG